MIKHLSRDHAVTVASIARSEREAREGGEAASHCDGYELVRVREAFQTIRMLLRLPTSTPSSMGFFFSQRLARKVKTMLRTRQYDLIVVNSSSVAQYVTGVEGIPKILDFCDMDSQKWLDYARFKPFPLSLGYRLEGIKLMREEKRLANCFDVCTTATRGELETLNSYRCDVETDWFPNGVDAEYFSPSEGPYDENTISFIGRMNYYPNEECMSRFCRGVWPALRQRKPQVKLNIVGADPTAAVRRLGELPGVTVTGTVADVRPYVRRSAVSVAPLNIARGTQNKILEAMSMGVPVVSSPLAASGVDATPGEHLLVAQNPAEYTEAILRVMEQPTERARLAVAGRRRMVSHHSWDASMRRLDAILGRCQVASARPGLTKLSETAR
jgi:sugar transferase (PEP-CTERM/EpsH1 system associated)